MKFKRTTEELLNYSTRYYKYVNPAICFVFSAWALFLRFKATYERILSNDEVYQLIRTVGSFKPIWLRNYYGDFSCFPGDYLLTYPFITFFLGQIDSKTDPFLFKNVIVLDAHKWGLLIPHILVTILGFYVLYLLCRRYFKNTWGYIVAFAVVCFNSHLASHAFEFRSYAFLPTLSLASFYFIDLLFCQYDNLGRTKKVLIGAFLLLVACFHVFGIIFLVLSIFYLFVFYRPSMLGAVPKLKNTCHIIIL